MGAVKENVIQDIKNKVSEVALVEVWNVYAKAGYGDIHKLPSFKEMDKVLVGMFVKSPLVGGVLDAGCGDGTFFSYILKGIRPVSILGVDWSQEMLKVAEKKSQLLHRDFGGVDITLQKVNLGEPLHWREGLFDAVVCHMVACYIPKPWQEVWGELLRVTKKGGYLYLTTFLSGWDFSKIVKKHSPTEFLKSPIGLYHGLRLKKYPAQATEMAKKAGLKYPSLEGLYNFFRGLGCREIISVPVFWGAAVAMRVRKA